MAQKTKDALDILGKVTEDDPELRQMIEEETLNAEISRRIYDARQQAGLTQLGLAELAGTTQSVTSRLEDADYEGHSLSMLQRIATALNQKVEICFSPLQHVAKT